MLKKILIANRGEIAMRVIHACRHLGIPSVAVFSEADRHSSHVRSADEAVFIGPSPPLESYLNIDNVIQAARKAGADAIHPGYGFLAENYRFARACEQADLIFIGPPAEAIRKMGNKLEAREMMKNADVPIIPGTEKRPHSIADLRNEAVKMGFPVLIKAASGGGGKGMRIVRDEESFSSAAEGAVRESKAAFGDETVYLEKYIERPRHVEFQVIADRHGNAAHLFERECSIQRRHQKIVEETPCVALTPELREQMGEAAVAATTAAGYVNAGTVEFLLSSDMSFYFLEMNTRIQVEHPVTEMVVGVDLVVEQIRIASGEPLSFSQADLSQTGHAIECRIYAEDPMNNFLPSPGIVLDVIEPGGPGIRHDSGFFPGYEVSVYYDPILSKLIAWGRDREEARIRMCNALKRFTVLGIKTCIPYLIDLIEHPDFIAGKTDTGFIERNMTEWSEIERKRSELDIALAAAAITGTKQGATTGSKEGPSSGTDAYPSPWRTAGGWRIGD